MQRIWNEEELKSMPEWAADYEGNWFKKGGGAYLLAKMIGKPIDSLIGLGYTINDYMIATEPKEEPISDKEILDSSVNAYTDGEKIIFKENNMETKKVTLNNGTVLEVGKKYRNHVKTILSAKCLSICDEFCWMKIEGTNGVVLYKTQPIHDGWLPYTPPTPQKEWKTFLIERGERSQNGRVIMQFLSLEDAKSH